MVWVVGRVDVKLSDMGPKYIFDAGFILLVLAQQLDIACDREVLHQAKNTTYMQGGCFLWHRLMFLSGLY